MAEFDHSLQGSGAEPDWRVRVHDEPDGVLDVRSGIRAAWVEKVGARVLLKVGSPEGVEIQSALHLGDPLKLLSPYTRALVLAMLWPRDPRRVHVLGLGGGRVPMFLRHHWPHLEIDCTEIDPGVVDLARGYFGFREDERMRVSVGDGRLFLESRAGEDPYDVIFVDAFTGEGSAPLRLSTREFFQECRRQLNPSGVVAVNILPNGGLVPERLATLVEVFQSVQVYQGEGALVAYASPLSGVALRRLQGAAMRLDAERGWDLGLAGIARKMVSIGRDSGRGPEPGVEVIRDDQAAHPPL